MGCDGGSIPRRSEVVKSKPKDEIRDKQADLAAKWHFCHLSGLPLTKPIVACQLGNLYNKDRLIEYLLEAKYSQQLLLPHIRTLKDVKEIKLTDKVDSNQGVHQISGNEKYRAEYICPISGLDMNGKYKFQFSIKCGCVVSEKAMKEVTDAGNCIVCSEPYDPELDIITINGDEDDITKLKSKIELRKQVQKLTKQKKTKKTLEGPIGPSKNSSDDNQATAKEFKRPSDQDICDFINAHKKQRITN